MNYIDLALLVIIGYYLYQGYKVGFFHLTLELLGMTLSLVLGLLLYSHVGVTAAKFLKLFKLTLSPIWANPLGFFLIWFIAETVFFTATHYFLSKSNIKFIGSKKDRIFSFIPAILKGLIFGAIFLSLFVSLPVEGSIKKNIFESKIGGQLVKLTDKLDTAFESIFGGAIRQSMNFITIKPGSHENYDLGFTTNDFKVDEASETRMLELVNEERAKVGLAPLTLDRSIVPVARAHSEDMFRKGYFAHINQEGKGPCGNPDDRMDAAGIKYTYCGENLAYAPDVEIAHRGLMNSPGHRANILEPNYTRIGIGVIDGGSYGEMFTQNFAG